MKWIIPSSAEHRNETRSSISMSINTSTMLLGSNIARHIIIGGLLDWSGWRHSCINHTIVCNKASIISDETSTVGEKKSIDIRRGGVMDHVDVIDGGRRIAEAAIVVIPAEWATVAKAAITAVISAECKGFDMKAWIRGFQPIKIIIVEGIVVITAEKASFILIFFITVVDKWCRRCCRGICGVWGFYITIVIDEKKIFKG